MKKLFYRIVYFFLFSTFLYSQQAADFNVEKYKQFLSQNKNMTSTQLQQMYNMGSYKDKIASSVQKAAYYDSVTFKYKLTEYENSLIAKHGFMVTERLNYPSMGEALIDIFNKDLPIFITADALLHAFHSSYDRILKDVEQNVVVPKLKIFLYDLQSKTKDLDFRYSSNAEMKNSLRDFDLYLTIALQLLGESVKPYYSDNNTAVNDLMKCINAEQAASYKIFGESLRAIDFSQFKPRGHYASDQTPIMANYFKTAMWLGRIEFYLIAPRAFEKTDPKDVRRQSADAMLILEAAELSGAFTVLNELEDIIGFFVGEQDNVTLPDMRTLKLLTGVTGADELLDSLTHKMFCDTLKTESFAFQKILSQILTHDPMSPDSIMPASAFMPFGQRFVIDSYITGNVVYDKTITKRMLPSMLDVLFALGNNPAGTLLKGELDKFKYADILAGLRYLLDSYGDETWNSTIYNMWLNSIRKLNSPTDKSALPEFMQTAAYWQEKMNTQLSSWTELRHDNLLYAKQSYSGGVSCSYPYGYVEPLPEFYKSMKLMCEISRDKFKLYNFEQAYMQNIVTGYFDYFSKIADTLAQIAAKELNNTPFTQTETVFLQNMLTQNKMCGAPYIGWYPALFYRDTDNKDGLKKQDYLVADMHTSPTDEFGNTVGWVKHCGTGPANMGVWIADLPGGAKTAFAGPVMSYYEHTTTNFLRLTDDEWLNTYQTASARPDFVNLYLAGNTGVTRGDGPTLTSVKNADDGTKTLPVNYLVVRNYPNPFNPSTIISFTIPYNLSGQKTELAVYNIQGELVKQLVNEVLPSGTYYTEWNGKNSSGNSVASGIYLYRLTSGGGSVSGKMNLIK